MTRTFTSLVLLLAFGCSAAATHLADPLSFAQEAVSPQQPLLTFDVVPIEGIYVVDEISGDAEILDEKQGWIAVLKGARLESGTKLRIGVGSSVVIRLPQGARAVLR